MSRRKTIYKPAHEEPGEFFLNYILLPYGAFYKKTLGFLDAKPGDTVRFYKGREFEITKAILIEDPELADVLCRMRYGVNFVVALRHWGDYAVMEGHNREVLSSSKCIMLAYGKEVDTKARKGDDRIPPGGQLC